MRTKPHQRFIPPTAREVDDRFKELEFNLPYSYDLAFDLANAASHEHFGGSSLDSIVPIKLNRTNYDTDKEYAEAIAYHQNVQEFIKTVDFSAYSGGTPLAKAASIIAALSSDEDGKPGDGDGAALPIFKKSTEDMKKSISKMEDRINAVVEAAKTTLAHLTEKCNSPEMLLQSISESQMKVLDHIAVLQKRGNIKSKRNPAETTLNRMSEYSQVGSTSPVNMLLPTFGYKFATKQLVVKEPKQSCKQLLILAIDDSSSMTDDGKRPWVRAIISNRLTAVLEGKAELLITWFLQSPDEKNSIYLRNKKDVQEYIKSFFIGRFGGNSTNVQNTILVLQQAIKDGMFGEHKFVGVKPEIVIMNDGQDTVGFFKPAVRTHAFILGQDNEGLQAVITASGGTFERFL